MTGNAIPEHVLTAWLEAAGEGDTVRVHELLGAYPALLDMRGGEGTRTALHRAVFGGHLDMIALLLGAGADPNVRCEGDVATPLHFAAEQERMDMIRALVEHGADPIGEGDMHGLTVIGWATVFGAARTDVVDYLLAHGARHTIPSAVASGNVDAIRAAAAREPAALERPLDDANRRRRPLHLAVTKGQMPALRALLDLGADLEATDAGGLTALDQAALQGAGEMVEFLLAHGARLNLPAAVGLGRTADVDRLLAADPGCVRPGGRWGTLIVRASERSGATVIEALVRAGADVNVPDDPLTAVDGARGYTALHAAGFFGNLEAARALIALGANPCAREERYAGTPAGWAAYAGHEAVRDLILEAPLDVFAAIEFGLPERLPAILAKDPGGLVRPFGAYVRAPSRPGQWWPVPECSPLAWAIERRQLEATRVLLEAGAPLDGVTLPTGWDDLDALLRARGAGN